MDYETYRKENFVDPQPEPKFDFIDRSWNEVNGAPDTTGVDDGTDKIDYPLAEIATALKNGLNIVPVLVGGVEMPAPSMLTSTRCPTPPLRRHQSAARTPWATNNHPMAWRG